jgi:short-subunit dehydrogenase
VVQFAHLSLPKPSPASAALVTGASAGIGRALVLVARRRDRLLELAEELRAAHDVRAEAIACDLTDAAKRSKLPAQVAELGFDVEILINNAGFATGGPFHESDPDRELEQVRILVEAPVGLISAFAPAMVERGRGAILNVASTAGMQPMPYSAGYGAAKAYVLSFSEAIHHELRGHGITVTALCPGPVETDFWDIAGWHVKGGASFEKAVPKPMRISAEEAARAGVRGLESGDRVVVPGLPMRTAMLASRYIPHWFKLPAMEWVMRPGGRR